MANKFLLIKTGADEKTAIVKIDHDGELRAEEFNLDLILVETNWGQETAKIMKIMDKAPKQGESSEVKFLNFFKTNDQDLKSYLINAKKKEKEALNIFKDSISKNDLGKSGMKPIKTNLPYDQKKLIFYYTAPDRVDFRGLLRDLIGQFPYIIRLQQISPRQAASIIGGVGVCGQEVCCHRFLYDLPKVNKEILYEQDLADTNKEKFKGPCGRLRCCLIFEQKNYQDAAKNLPKIGEKVMIKNEVGTVLSKNILKQEFLVEFKNGNRGTYPLAEIKK
jgi:cell fate regulator YaaT (PSP1 superfamily)